ncbi:Gp37-like protein [Cellulomonas soli]|uniref:Gp37-like protein n=1 Tax=Cellulomonas soli TaxID=931535 RepID=UPI003F8780AF
MIDEPFEVVVYDRTFQHTGWVGDFLSLTATPRHNQQPTGSITVAADSKKAGLLLEPGARAVIRYRDEHLLGGPCRLRSAQGAGPKRALTLQIRDDWWLLSRALLWPVPGAPISNQSAAKEHTVTGPAETVAKTLLGAAITRLGLPITVAPDLGRGSTITVSARMALPADVLYPLVDQAGIGITVRQIGAGLVLDAYEPTAWPINLSEDGGTITEGDWSLQPPEPTRVVLGADGEDQARTFRALVDHAAEAQWDTVEAFIDARDLKHTDPGFETAATARMQAALAAGALRSGLSVKLAETQTFRYGGDGVHVGDLVTVDLADGVTVTEVLREATLSQGNDGTNVTPVVGEHRDDPNQILAAAIAAALRAQRLDRTRS